MFDVTNTQNEPEAAFSLNQLSELDLLLLREQINTLLPPKYLKDINLEEELVAQFRITRALQTDSLATAEEPQKKATVLNACAATLQALVKMQADLYTAERLKEIEGRLIKALEKVPSQYLVEFFEFYESDMNTGKGV